MGRGLAIPGPQTAKRFAAFPTFEETAMPLSRSVRVMIVEDESLVALSVADVLADEGFTVIGPVSTQAEALSLLDTTHPDAVILDLSLRDGFCAGLAKELHKQSMPFVVFSGYPRRDRAGAEFRDVPWIEKPGTIAGIVAGIRSVVTMKRRALAA
jgi:DNA-binding response OmpR family regulator